jgi:excisionase family DNA binding protein
VTGSGNGKAATVPPLIAALLAELANADESVKCELAGYLHPSPDEPGRLLDVAEFAPLVKLHPETCVRMARDGRVWAVKVGREWRFRADRLEVTPPVGLSLPLASAVRPRRKPIRKRASSIAISGRS